MASEHDNGTPAGEAAENGTLRLKDGRDLAYVEVGSREGVPVFFFHGAPGSGLGLIPYAADFAARGLRAIGLDRPSYGGSSPQPGRTREDWPRDVAEAADALGIGRFLVAAHSSGGPYAAACAALLPGRVAGAVIVSGVTDMGWAPAWDGFFETEAAMMRLPDEQAVAARCAELFGADGSAFFDAPGLEFSAPDQAAMEDEAFMAATMESFGAAFAQGVGGYAQDIFVQGRPWSFDPAAIAAPAIVLHGEADTIVPLAHGRHTASLVPGASLRVLPGHGHISILRELAGACAELAG